MKTFSTGLVGVALLAQTAVASAAPVVFNKNEAVAASRRDFGTGVCGSVAKFAVRPPLMTVDEAIAILDKPAGDPAVVGRTARLFPTMDFSVGRPSDGDFIQPAFVDQILPFCQDPQAMPMGTDDNNIAMRLRGYLNVNSNNSGHPITFALHCDDGCSLRIGKSRQQVLQADAASPTLTKRRARWVTFADPGLYPVELVYYQNSTLGLVEWSYARGAIFSGDDVAISNVEWFGNQFQFKPAGADLHSAIVGASSECTECRSAADCRAGSFCNNDLCHPCNLSERCGPSCAACPSSQPVCLAGSCVQCSADSDCVTGQVCDLVSGACKPPTRCTSSDACAPDQRCSSDGYCGPAETPCYSDAGCAQSEVCRCPDFASSCLAPRCFAAPFYEGGCQAGSGTRRISDGWLMPLALLAGLGIFLRRRATTG